MSGSRFMLIAGETSGDALAAGLVRALLSRSDGPAPRFFGAGRGQMADAGVEIAVDMTPLAVLGISDVVKRFLPIRRAFNRLQRLALERQPDVIIGVDYGGFNLRFAAAVRRGIRARRGTFNNWEPRLVQFVSPQVWASRERRAWTMQRDLDLLLSIFPFESGWYARRVPGLRVEFVGHPIFDRYPDAAARRPVEPHPGADPVALDRGPRVLLLPGSRPSELRRHLPVMLDALERIKAGRPEVQASMVLPDEGLVAQAKEVGMPPDVPIQVGGLAAALRSADLAITKTGTVTVECAYFGVPAVTLYKTSWTTYQIAKRKVRVNTLTMPNLLAGEAVFPEFLQDAANGPNIARVALELLNNASRRADIRAKLARVVGLLGGPGASDRAAEAILGLLSDRSPSIRASLGS